MSGKAVGPKAATSRRLAGNDFRNGPASFGRAGHADMAEPEGIERRAGTGGASGRRGWWPSTCKADPRHSRGTAPGYMRRAGALPIAGASGRSPEPAGASRAPGEWQPTCLRRRPQGCAVRLGIPDHDVVATLGLKRGAIAELRRQRPRPDAAMTASTPRQPSSRRIAVTRDLAADRALP
jgi:hypothetical protein